MTIQLKLTLAKNTMDQTLERLKQVKKPFNMITFLNACLNTGAHHELFVF